MKILYFSHLWPRFDQSAAGVRTFGLLKALSKLPNSEIIYVSPQNIENEYAKKLNCQTISLQINDLDGFKNALSHINPKISFFDTFIAEEFFSWKVNNLFPDCIRICDTQDIRTLRKFRQNLVENENLNWKQLVNREPTTDGPESDLLSREIASIYRSDLNLVISPFEMNLLNEKYKIPKEKLFLTQFCYQKNPNKVKEFNDRKNFFMIGNFNHEPNFDSFKYLKKHIWPKIHQKLPESKMHIYGAIIKKECHQWSLDDPSFKVIGHLKDLNKLQDFRVQIVPLRYGAGIKGKITDSWYYGTPVITSFIGTEGMTINKDINQWGGFECWDENEFIEKSIEIYQNETLWKEKQENGYQIMNELFNEDKNNQVFLKQVNDLLLNIHQKRKYDVVQKLLWDTSFRITEIMSKSIIDKKKKENTKIKE